MARLNGSISALKHIFDALYTLARGNGEIGLQLLNYGTIRAFTLLWVAPPSRPCMADNLAFLVLNLLRLPGVIWRVGYLRELQ
jgi:hypothetical protein